MPISQHDIESTRQSICFQTQAFIDGGYVAAQSGETFDCISPIDGNKLADVAACDQVDVDLAVAAAKRSYESGVWAAMAPSERKQILLRFADLMERHRLRLAVMETLDMGKPISDALSDVAGACARLRWTAEATDKVYDLVAPTAHDVFATIRREPIGVVGTITPWNFPIFLAVIKIAPALACGNSVVIKPAEQSPLTALALMELATEAGIPPGVLNAVPGFGETAGRALSLHNDVGMVSFTGSTEVGRLMMQYSGQSNLKRVHLECGGKSPNIVFADAPDLVQAARESAQGVFHNSGQICCAPTRLLVENSVKAQVLETVQQVALQFQPSQPLDLNTQMGSMVDVVQFKRVMGYIESGKRCAHLLCGGEQLMQHSGGYYVAPTVFDEVDNQSVIAQQEIFGPVLSVIGFDHVDEAIAIANATDYGLAASLWAADINKAHAVSAALRAGIVGINTTDPGGPSTTFGGYKQSGIGVEGGMVDFDNYSELKTTWLQLT